MKGFPRTDVRFAAAITLIFCQWTFAKDRYDPIKFRRAFEESDYRVVGSERRIGPIRLGMYMDEVAAILGPPQTVGGNGQDDCLHCIPTLWTYDNKNFQIGFSKGRAPFVAQIAVWDDPRFATDDGIRVGMSFFDLARMYGPSDLRFVCLAPNAELMIFRTKRNANAIAGFSLFSPSSGCN